LESRVGFYFNAFYAETLEGRRVSTFESRIVGARGVLLLEEIGRKNWEKVTERRLRIDRQPAERHLAKG